MCFRLLLESTTLEYGALRKNPVLMMASIRKTSLFALGRALLMVISMGQLDGLERRKVCKAEIG
jgi:hypothetical protein